MIENRDITSAELNGKKVKFTTKINPLFKNELNGIIKKPYIKKETLIFDSENDAENYFHIITKELKAVQEYIVDNQPKKENVLIRFNEVDSEGNLYLPDSIKIDGKTLIYKKTNKIVILKESLGDDTIGKTTKYTLIDGTIVFSNNEDDFLIT